MPEKTTRKNDGAEAEDDSAVATIPGAVSATEARDILGKLLNRAGFGGERIPITDRGEVKAWIIGPKDLELLDQLSQSGGNDRSDVREHERTISTQGTSHVPGKSEPAGTGPNKRRAVIR